MPSPEESSSDTKVKSPEEDLMNFIVPGLYTFWESIPQYLRTEENTYTVSGVFSFQAGGFLKSQESIWEQALNHMEI